MTGALAFAFMAGAVSTANPCGFALLPAYLARRLGADAADSRGVAGAVAGALAAGAVTTLGFLLIFGVAGGIVGLGANWLTGAFPWAGFAVGIVLAATGLAVAAGWHIRIRLPMARPATPGSGWRGDLLFGIGYGIASLSCTLPVFLTVIGAAVTWSPVASAVSFAAYALGMGTIFTGLAIGAALSRHGIAAATARLAPYVNRASGVLLFLAGAYVSYLWGEALFARGPLAASGITAAGERLSGTLRGWIAGTTGQTVAYGVLALLAVLFAWTLWRRGITKTRPTRRRARPTWPRAPAPASAGRGTRDLASPKAESS